MIEDHPRMKDDDETPHVSNSSITRVTLHEDRQRLSDLDTKEKDLLVPRVLWRIQHGDRQNISDFDTKEKDLSEPPELWRMVQPLFNGNDEFEDAEEQEWK